MIFLNISVCRIHFWVPSFRTVTDHCQYACKGIHLTVSDPDIMIDSDEISNSSGLFRVFFFVSKFWRCLTFICISCWEFIGVTYRSVRFNSLPVIHKMLKSHISIVRWEKTVSWRRCNHQIHIHMNIYMPYTIRRHSIILILNLYKIRQDSVWS